MPGSRPHSTDPRCRDIGAGPAVGATFLGAEVADFLQAAPIAVVGEVPLERPAHALVDIVRTPAQTVRIAGRTADRHTEGVLTVFGAAAVTFMMLMYALERRGPRFVLAFACGCALSSAYGFLAGTWPFGVVEAIWAVIALRRYSGSRSASPPSASD